VIPNPKLLIAKIIEINKLLPLRLIVIITNGRAKIRSQIMSAKSPELFNEIEPSI
jgi:hypothetical protein